MRPQVGYAVLHGKGKISSSQVDDELTVFAVFTRKKDARRFQKRWLLTAVVKVRFEEVK